MIGFARECKALGRLERFVHVSTAYVSGKQSGTFRERQLDAAQEFRNTYEQTKWEAEHVVMAAGDLAPAIARPSIVMGEADTGWTPAFNVLYWPLRAFSRGLFDEIPALPAAHVDVVPVDYVADALVHLLDIPTRACSTSSRAATRRSRTSSWSSPATASTARGRRSPTPATVRGRRRDRCGVPAVLRHGRPVRRLARPRDARAGGHHARRGWRSTSTG